MRNVALRLVGVLGFVLIAAPVEAKDENPALEVVRNPGRYRLVKEGD